MASFGNLYNFNVEGGVVVEQTSAIKTSVENAFKEIFGNDFSTDESSINGRLIEAIVVHFKDVLGVNAQNVNALNIERAVGLYLDNLGAAFGVGRLSGESDSAYRLRIVESFSRGSGFASSIRNAVGAVSGVTKCVVLDNGNEDPQVLPRDAAGNALPHSIAVKPHSVFISVLGGATADIVAAVGATKACGCGIENTSEYGALVSNTFYIPTERTIAVSLSVSSVGYHGLDIVADTKAAVKACFDANSINSTITKEMVQAAVASLGSGIVCTAVTFTEGVNSLDRVVLPAYNYVNLATNQVTVNVL